VAWIVRLVSTGAEGEEHSTDVLRIARPDDLADLASLGLTLGESKRLLAGLQREIVAAQARVHAARRPACRSCGATCRLKDYRRREIATLFGRVTVRLPRFRCAGCRTIVAGMEMKPGRLPRPVFLLGFDAGHGRSVPVRRRGDLAPVEAERPPQLSRVELEGLTPFRVAGEEPQGPGLEEEPAGRKAGPGLAHRECREQRATGGGVLVHELFQGLGDAMDRPGRGEREPVGEFLVGDGKPGPSLSQELFPQMIPQSARHAPPHHRLR